MMRSLRLIAAGAAIFLVAPKLFAGSGEVPPEARAAQVVFLGEAHDNPAHHTRQAAWVAELAPTALVFEMLPPDVDPDIGKRHAGDVQALEAALTWEARGWPDFASYFPIFAAAPEAAILGAEVSRSAARSLMQSLMAGASESEAATFGPSQPLPEAEQTARETLQAEAHCNALPPEMLPVMVEIQRLRDSALERAAREALDIWGPPVVVITGNGHARTDWGAPALIVGYSVFSLGQSEDGRGPAGTFDLVLDAPAVSRDDPCAAFR